MKDLDIIMGWNIGEGQTQAEELAQMEEQAEAEAEYNRTLEAEYNKACEEQQAFEEALEARVAELEAALGKAALYLYEATGSCPSDLYDWEHPNTCIRECDRYDNPDEAWKCWRLWLLEKPKEGK